MSSGVSVVCRCVQLNKCSVLCVWCPHSGQCGVVCVSGDILCRYDMSSGDLFVLSCASVLRVVCDRVCSDVSIVGGI